MQGPVTESEESKTESCWERTVNGSSAFSYREMHLLWCSLGGTLIILGPVKARVAGAGLSANYLATH